MKTTMRPQSKALLFAAIFFAISMSVSAQDTIARVGQPGVEPPQFTKRVAPEYPAAAVEDHLEGYVILEVILRKDGSVDDIKVLRGLGKGEYGFEDSATEAVQQWQFKPGTIDGEMADVRMTLKIDFVLDGKKHKLKLNKWTTVGDVEYDSKPSVKMLSEHYQAATKLSHLNLLVTVQLDNRGQVIEFELDNSILKHFKIPEQLYEKVETAINKSYWQPAKHEGQGIPTTVKLNIPIIL